MVASSDPEDAGDADGCELCGLSLGADAVTADGAAFCCAGCRDVARVLDDVAGVDETTIRQRVRPDRADEAEHDDLGDHEADAPPEGCERAFLRVDGMYCRTCEAFVESLAAATDGVADARASYVTEAVRVDYDSDAVSEDEIADALTRSRYTAYRRADDRGRGDATEDLLWRLAGGVMLGMMVMIPYFIYIYPVHFQLLYSDRILALAREQLETARYFYYFLFLWTSAVLFYTGGPLLRGALVSLRVRRPNMDLLVALAAVSAYLYSTLVVLFHLSGLHPVEPGNVYFDVAVGIVLVVTAGTYYESTIKRRATEQLSELTTARADEARRYEDGVMETVPVDDLRGGDAVLVREGERVPVDGTVREGECTVDEAVVTGESLPVEKGPGDPVVGGSTVAGGAPVIDVDAGATSSLDRIVDLVWEIQSTSTGVQKLADRLAVVFVPAVLALAAFAGVAWLLLGEGVTAALLVALTVLIVSCPCALGLATPLAVASGIREAMANGLVVFDETVFERLRDVDVLVFDKTGTLTTGEMAVREADAPDDLLAAAATLEDRASHPAARAIGEAFGGAVPGEPRADGGAVEDHATTPEAEPMDGPDDGPTVSDFESHPTGVEGVVDGRRVLVGHPSLFAEQGWTVPDAVAERASEARAEGHLPVVVGADEAAEGVVIVGDEAREGWDDTLAAVADRGVDVVVLTGDGGASAERFREHDAVSEVFAGVPSEGKAAAVDRLAAGRQVAMVGDGTNDAPALAGADLGIAMGGGTALAVDAADVAVVDDDLASIPAVFDLATATRRRVKQNVGWALCYNGVAIPLALTGLLNPLFAAAAMATSSILVVTNSSRDLLDD